MPRRSRVDRRGSVLLGTGMTLPRADTLPEAPESHETASEASKTTTGAHGDADDPLSAVYAVMSEREFQRHVVDGLIQRGYLVWHVVDSRLMAAGLPDIIAVHPTRIPRRVHFWELKRECGGRVSRKQRAVLEVLGDVYGVDAQVVRPSGLAAILEELDR